MTARRVATLLVAAVVIIALGMWLSSRRIVDAESGAGAPVIAGLKAQVNDVSEVRISRGDGSKVTLRKTPTAWIVAEREFPADSGKVRKLLLDLSDLSIVEPKTSDPEKYAQLGVEDTTTPTASGTRVELTAPDKVHAVIIGRSSGMKSSYMRATDAKQSVLATPQVMVETDPKRWLDTSLVDIAEEKIREIEVTPPSGPSYKVAREKKEDTTFNVTNIPKGRELSSPEVASTLARELASFTLSDVQKASGAPAARPKAIYRTFDGLELQLTGREDGERRYITVAATSTAADSEAEAQKLAERFKDWEFEIPNYKYDGIFKPLEELLKPKDSK